MPYLKFSRDKRGYETSRSSSPAPDDRGKPPRPRLLFWFRTPPQVKVGREPFPRRSPPGDRSAESRHLKFDWPRLTGDADSAAGRRALARTPTGRERRAAGGAGSSREPEVAEAEHEPRSPKSHDGRGRRSRPRQVPSKPLAMRKTHERRRIDADVAAAGARPAETAVSGGPTSGAGEPRRRQRRRAAGAAAVGDAGGRRRRPRPAGEPDSVRAVAPDVPVRRPKRYNLPV